MKTNYKSICLIRNEKIEEAKTLLKESEADYKIGYFYVILIDCYKLMESKTFQTMIFIY